MCLRACVSVIGCVEEFKEVLSLTAMHELVPFNAECPMVKTYFGQDGSRRLDFQSFSQLLQVSFGS